MCKGGSWENSHPLGLCCALWSTGKSPACSKLTNSAALGQSPNLPKPQFPYLYNGCDSSHFTRLLKTLRSSMHVMHLVPQNHPSQLDLSLNHVPSLIGSYVSSYLQLNPYRYRYIDICLTSLYFIHTHTHT